jgi:hypothetical protein
LLPVGIYLLLDLSLWIQYLPGVYARKYVGNVLQWHHLDMPGLRRAKWLWQPIRMIFLSGGKNHDGQDHFN